MARRRPHSGTRVHNNGNNGQAGNNIPQNPAPTTVTPPAQPTPTAPTTTSTQNNPAPSSPTAPATSPANPKPNGNGKGNGKNNGQAGNQYSSSSNNKNQGSNNPPVTKEQIEKDPDMYKAHFTEDVLIQQAEQMMVYDLSYNGILFCSKFEWTGCVYAELPFGEVARGRYMDTRKQWYNFSVKVISDKDETIELEYRIKGLQRRMKIEHLTIKHGYMNYFNRFIGEPELDPTEPETKHAVPVKKEPRSFGPKKRDEVYTQYVFMGGESC